MTEYTTIGIIGGTGVMGQWFKHFFEQYGYTVLIAGRKTELTHEECAQRSDIVIVSVPIDVTVETIKRIGPYVKKDALLMDLTSVKEEPVEAMLTHSQAQNIVGTHPVFGPGIQTMEQQSIVLCPARGTEGLQWLTDIFTQGGARIKTMTAQHHDHLMGVIQGVIHFSSITISHTLRELGISVQESLDVSSPIYSLRLDMVGRILNQDPWLYANIEIHNPSCKTAINAYMNTAKQLLNIIRSDNKEAFVNYFNEAADYLGDFKQQAENNSNYLIQKIIEKNSQHTQE